MRLILESSRKVLFCLAIMGFLNSFASQGYGAETFETVHGLKIRVVFYEVGIGAVGVHRERGRLRAITSFYRSGPAGIEVEILRPWFEYDRFVKSRDRAVCLRHVVRLHKRELFWEGDLPRWPSPGDSFGGQLEDNLSRRQIIYQMRKRGSKNLWYYCRFLRFETPKGYQGVIPLTAFQGTPVGDRLLSEFAVKSRREMQQQGELARRNRQRMDALQAEIRELAPKGPFGPDFAALGPGPRRGRIFAMQREFMRERILLQWRSEYVFRLRNAR